MPPITAIAFHGVILRHPPPSGRELWLNSPDLDAFSFFYQLRDTTYNIETVKSRLAEKMPEWEANDIVPTEEIPDGQKTNEPIRYGANYWRDMFSPRQLLCHGTSVEVFRELLDLEQSKTRGALSEVTKAAFVYLAVVLDKYLNYDSRMSVWMSTREIMANTFNRHDFAFCWSYAEMPPLVVGIGYDWAIEQTGKCIKELIELTRPGSADGNGPLFDNGGSGSFAPPLINITYKSADNLEHLADTSIDVIVMDPPYYDNVMYAELSDFFYVWLKRTAGRVVPELFTRALTDKEHEAVANPARFKGQPGAKASSGARLPGADGRNFHRMPPRTEAGRPNDPDVHSQGDGSVGRSDQGPDARGLCDFSLLAYQHRGRRQHAHQGQGCGQQHDLPRLPPARRGAARRIDRLLGRRGAAGCAGGPYSRRGIPEGRNRRRRSLPRLIRSCS